MINQHRDVAFALPLRGLVDTDPPEVGSGGKPLARHHSRRDDVVDRPPMPAPTHDADVSHLESGPPHHANCHGRGKSGDASTPSCRGFTHPSRTHQPRSSPGFRRSCGGGRSECTSCQGPGNGSYVRLGQSTSPPHGTLVLHRAAPSSAASRRFTSALTDLGHAFPSWVRQSGPAAHPAPGAGVITSRSRYHWRHSTFRPRTRLPEPPCRDPRNQPACSAPLALIGASW